MIAETEFILYVSEQKINVFILLILISRVGKMAYKIALENFGYIKILSD